MTRKKLDEQPAATAVPASKPLITKHRPKSLAGMVGQGAITKSISKAIQDGPRPHAFLFSGPAGCGKTSLARIVASMVHCDAHNVMEVDAASNSGIDEMRAVTASLRYVGFGDSVNRAVIIDEAHALSKQAWDSLLKSLEEPPEHVYFLLCTTNPAKVPATIVSRCAHYVLSELLRDDMMDFLERVCELERFETSDRILAEVVRSAQGSPRKALSALQLVHDCRDEREAAIILSQPLEDAEIIQLLRDMVSGRALKWAAVVDVLRANKDNDPEGLRLMIVNYLNAVLLGERGASNPARLLDCLSAFMRPVSRSEKMAGLLLAFADIVYAK